MTLRCLAALLGIAALGLAGEASGQDRASPPLEKGAPVADMKKGDTVAADAKDKDKAKDKDAGPKKPKIEKATFGGGCFWSFEAVFERIPGVKSVTSGFSGGSVANPSYEMVCTGQTGHAEVIQIEYDASVVPFEKLLTVFWKAHDPTTPNAQGDDIGPQYRSIILYHDDAQKKAVQKSYQELKARKAFRSPIVTELVPMVAFFPAEPYHQDYFLNHLDNDYSQNYIIPKLRKLKLLR